MHCKRGQRSRRQNGLTLRQTLLTLSVVAILLGIGLHISRDQLADGLARVGDEQLYAAV